MSRKETERTKLIQEKCQTLLTQMLRDEDNKYCVDCDAKGPRWASWNLGVFLCIRCAGIHRNLGVHISRVKSVNLDTWTPEQVISLQQMGNSRARAVYEAQLPDGFRRPQTDTALESFIRAKYEHKKYLAREWVPPPPPKVDWAKEIDDELERQKRKKKASAACSTLGLSVGTGCSIGAGMDKKSSALAAAKSTPLPAPLPKPKPGQCGSSPKTQRIVPVASTSGDASHSNDLLGLSSPTKPMQPVAVGTEHSDTFSGFLSAAPVAVTANGQGAVQNNNLAQEEEDFFNQSSIGAMGDKDKTGKLTKDSILALYGAAPPNPAASVNVATAHNPHNPPLNYGQPPMFGANGAFAGIAPGYMPHPHQQQQHQQQFMTPPNSASMNVYNAPVMTAPTAFGHATFSAQFPMQGISAGAVGPTGGFPQQITMGGAGGGGAGGGAGGLMTTGQLAANLNLMQTNQSLISGMSMNMSPLGMGMGMAMGPPQMGGMSSMSALPASNANNATATANLNQQFGNLNLGNVWQ